MANLKLKQAMRANSIPQWKVADFLGISEMTLIRWLRKEVSAEKYDKIMQAVEHLKKA